MVTKSSTTRQRMLEIAYVPGAEPTDEQRATVIAMMEFALKH